MEISLTLNSEDKINGLAQLLMVAAKAHDTNENGMRMALVLLDDIKAAVAAAQQKDVE
jgi:hypothetical protein